MDLILVAADTVIELYRPNSLDPILWICTRSLDLFERTALDTDKHIRSIRSDKTLHIYASVSVDARYPNQKV